MKKTYVEQEKRFFYYSDMIDRELLKEAGVLMRRAIGKTKTKWASDRLTKMIEIMFNQI